MSTTHTRTIGAAVTRWVVVDDGTDVGRALSLAIDDGHHEIFASESDAEAAAARYDQDVRPRAVKVRITIEEA